MSIKANDFAWKSREIMPNRYYIINGILLFILTSSTLSCFDDDKSGISNLRICFRGENILNAQVEFATSQAVGAGIQYWIVGEENKSIFSRNSDTDNNHKFVLPDLIPGKQYGFRVVNTDEKSERLSGNYFFKTLSYANGTVDSFRVVCSKPESLPDNFRKGYVMVHGREAPGTIFLLDVNGNVVWHHQLKDAGFKVVHFTKNKTFLGLVGTKGFETGYGNSILELSLTGDTLLYLQKGQRDFTQTIHHEILLNSKDEIVTLCNEDRIYDLRTRGGLVNDTVRGDGIIVMDRQGRKVWKWTVFDVMDPLADEQIMSKKKDWMHANSVSFDKDGNYLISFYNNGQVWKIDAITGRVIWKLGKKGDFAIPAWASFDQAHSVHINEQGNLMFFDNGSDHHLSKSVAFRLDEATKVAYPIIHTRLPPQLFSDRMGSSYLINNDLVLQCASRHKAVILTNFRGEFIWELRANRLMSYRAEFISSETLPAEQINSIYHTTNKKSL